MEYRFLAVCDNPALQELMQACAAQGGCLIEFVKTGSQGFKAIIAAPPDLVVVDAGISDIGGLTWLGILRQMKEGMDLPVIVAGEKMGPDEMAQAFDLGADDCVAFRHCGPKELSARIRAALRRRSGRAERSGAPLKLGPVELDPARHRCRASGREISLRPREFELLEALMRASGRVLARPYLLETVWGMSASANTRSVDVTVSRLRGALGKEAAGWVESVKKFGYRFRDPKDFAR